MRKSFISLIILISFPLLVAAGFNFGFIKAVKKKVEKVDEKVIEKKEEIRIANLNTAPTLSWTGETNYVSDGLNPEIGYSTTTFVYRIKYTDADNDAPASGYPKVHIKKGGTEISGSPFAMTYVSGANNTGAVYTYSTTTLLSGTDYTYYFEAQDSKNATATGSPTSSIDAPDINNTAPTLSWTGETNYVSDGLNPEIGYSTTTFVYRVTYTDTDNDAPASGYPAVHIKKGGAEISGGPFAMTYISGTNNTGAIYTYSKTLELGSDYTYFFEAKDALNVAATGAPLTAISSPTVTNFAPTLSWTGETNYISDGLNPETGTTATSFIYRVKYADADNDAPALGYPKVYIKKGETEISGSPFAMTYVSGANNTGAIYTYSTTTLLSGTDYTYYFEAQDSKNATATGSPTSSIDAPDINNTAPTLSWTGETNYVSDGLNPEIGYSTTTFVYRVKYTDADNDAPASGYPKVYIKKAGTEITGSPFTMTYVSGANNTGAVYTYSKVLTSTGTDYTYYFESKDIYSDMATGAPLTPIDAPDVSNIAPTLSWTGETNYISDGLNPESGDRSTDFIFRVKYTDMDNDAPATGYPKVHIKKAGAEISGSPFDMTETDAGDTTYTDGKLYTYTKVLTSTGTDYTYYFESKDIYSDIATGAPLTPIDAPDVSNIAPTLSWTGETNYISDGLNPESGDRSTNFIFRVKYADADNDAPASSYPKVHIKKAGTEITGSPFTMTYVSGANNTGVIYTYSGVLSSISTDYAYYFEAQDSIGTAAIGISTSPVDAPDVLNNAPILSWTGETNYETDGLNPETGTDYTTSFVYRIKYTDADNDPTSGPKVYIKKSGVEITNSPFTMTEVDSGDTTYTDGKFYTYTKVFASTGTDYTYYFEAKDVYSGNATGASLTSVNAPDVLMAGWTFGGPINEEAYSVQQTSDGGYIIIASSLPTGDMQAWLIKTDSAGTKSWDKIFGGGSYDGGYSVQQTSDSGYIIAGFTYSYAIAGACDVWLIRADSSGAQLWSKTFGGASYDSALSIKQTIEGGYIIAGHTESYGAGGKDIWLIKTDSGGIKSWDTTFGGGDSDYGSSVQQTSDGGYIISGSSSGAAVLIKTDSSGNQLWANTFSGTIPYSYGDSFVSTTTDGGYIVTGSSSVAGVSNVWLMKTDSDGNQLWGNTFGGSSSATGYSVQQTTDGGYIITGVRSQNVWLIKTDSNGTKLWDKSFGGIGNDNAYSVKQTSDDGYIITGYTESYGAGGKDVWLIKTDSDGNPQ